jgi:hypothetical protein
MKIIIRLFLIFAITFLCLALGYQFEYMPHAYNAWRYKHATEQVAIYYDGEGLRITCLLIYLMSAGCGLVALLAWLLTKTVRPRNQ